MRYSARRATATPPLLAQFNHQYGFDKPWFGQYLLWLGHLLQGNLGYSWNLDQSVASLLGSHLPKTVILVGISTILALIIAMPVGPVAGGAPQQPGRLHLHRLSFLFYAAPTFFVGTVLILVFRSSCMVRPERPQGGLWNDLTDLRDLTLPVVTLALVTIALFSRYMRSAVLDNVTEDYIRTARAKGASRSRVLFRHVLRNSLIPIATLLGLSLPGDLVRRADHRVGVQLPGHGLPVLQAGAEPGLPHAARLRHRGRDRDRGRVADRRHRCTPCSIRE